MKQNDRIDTLHQKDSVSADGSLVYWVTTDMHYLADELFDDGPVFQELLLTNDGKLIERGSEILDTFIEQAKNAKPDGILICGDLTFNGEKINLQKFTEKFSVLQETGIPVYVIPGNHDIDYPFSDTYIGDEHGKTENMNTESFSRIAGGFGYDNAISKDDSSFSYVTALSDDLWLMALDTNTHFNSGTLTDETFQWAEEQLKLAKEKNIQVITMSHQNVLKQNDMMYKGFVMNNHDEVETLLKKYDVYLNLSGHSHLQHTAISGSLTDICTESLSVYPLQFGILTISKDRQYFSYENKELGIYKDEAKDRFNETVTRMVEPQLKGLNITEDIRNKMIDFACEVNAYSYAGADYDKSSLLNSDEFGYWKAYGKDLFWYTYLKNMLEE